MRLRPCCGTQRVSAIACQRLLADPVRPSMRMNHCGVLRKISGAFDRQECG